MALVAQMLKGPVASVGVQVPEMYASKCAIGPGLNGGEPAGIRTGQLRVLLLLSKVALLVAFEVSSSRFDAPGHRSSFQKW